MKQQLLSEDPIIPGQKYALISYVLPKELEDFNKSIALKIRGAFDEKDIPQQIEKLKKLNEEFKTNIYTVEVGKWTEFATQKTIDEWDIQGLTDVTHSDERLNELLRKNKEAVENSKKNFEARKKQLQENTSPSNYDNEPPAVNDRIAANQQKLTELAKEMETLKVQLDIDRKIWKSFSPEKISEYDTKLKNHFKTLEL